jgi:Zn-finger nucleic acid-binding protein
MDCPVCKNVSLVMSERQGIEIDYCPNCRGVWLDRGELDKIIERSLTGAPAAAAMPPQAVPQRPPEPRYQQPDPRYQQPDPRYQQHDPRYQQQHQFGHSGYPHKKKKREGFLSDLFDFD